MKGGWFIAPQTDGRESILAPLPYIVQVKSVFLATMSQSRTLRSVMNEFLETVRAA